MTPTVFELHQATSPLLISMPHDGTLLAEGMAQRMTYSALRLPDTDWHVGQLYGFARELGAGFLRPNYSRYVIDLNRPPDDVSLYPGQNTTGLCPIQQFSGEPIYLSGQEPYSAEIAQRLHDYWQPYHQALRDEIARIRNLHGYAVVWEAHSIRSQVPFLFTGRLADLNLGTADGSSCTPAMQTALEQVLKDQTRFSWVVNGRFKGGYITRQYAQPEQSVQVIQMELAQCNYMDEANFSYLAERAKSLQTILRKMLEVAVSSANCHI